MKTRVRLAFTLVEVLVVLGIITILFALALPAISYSRELSMQSQCTSQLHQIGMAMHSFETANRILPPNGGFDGTSPLKNSDGSPLFIGTLDNDGMDHNWGIGSPLKVPAEQTGSWAFALLPYLDLPIVATKLETSARIDIYLCPSRSRPNPEKTVDDRWGKYRSGGLIWSVTDYAANSFLSPNLPSVNLSSAVKDGASNTVAVGEKAYDPSVQKPTSWYYDEPIFSGGAEGTARNGDKLLVDGQNIPFKGNWSSVHANGVNFVFLDGSIRPLSRDTDPEVVKAFITPSQND